MGIKLCPYSIATGEENYYLLAPNFKFIIKDKINYDTILDGIYVPDSKESFEEYWNYVKFTQIMIRSNKKMFSYMITGFIYTKWRLNQLVIV